MTRDELIKQVAERFDYRHGAGMNGHIAFSGMDYRPARLPEDKPALVQLIEDVLDAAGPFATISTTTGDPHPCSLDENKATIIYGDDVVGTIDLESESTSSSYGRFLRFVARGRYVMNPDASTKFHSGIASGGAVEERQG